MVITRYWVGGAGTWNTVTTTHWSATSGGAGGASAPSSDGNDYYVIFDSLSGTGTVTTSGALCTTLDLTGLAQSIFFSLSGTSLTIGGGSLLGSTYASFSQTGNIAFSVATIQTNGMVLGNIFIGAGYGETTLADDLVLNTDLTGVGVQGAITMTGGTLTTNDHNITCSYINCTSGFTDNLHLNLGSSTVTTTYWTIWTTDGGGTHLAILDAGTSTIRIVPSATVVGVYKGYFFTNTLSSQAIDYYNIEFVGNGVTNFLTYIGGAAGFTSHSMTFSSQPLSVVWRDFQGGTYNTLFQTNSLVAHGGSSAGFEFLSESGGDFWKISASNTDVSGLVVSDSYAVIPIRNYPDGLDDGGNTNWCFTELCYPNYNTSLISVVARVQQNLAFPQFVMAGQGGSGGSTYALFKKSDTGGINYWESPVFQIGKDFDIISITLPLITDLAAGTLVIPVFHFDDNTVEVTGTQINNTNYSNTNKLIILNAKNFGAALHGKDNFVFDLQFRGTALAVFSLPITIEVEIQDV